ncbi:MAG: hypothetical protein ACFFDB_02480 [Promethearchaeota archaeon]
MSNSKFWPILIGAAQYTQPKKTQKPPDPLKLISNVCKLAIDDTGITNLTEFIDAVYVVFIASWSYEDPPGELSDKLGINPSIKIFSKGGGNTSLRLLNEAALSLVEGKNKVVLLTGGETWYTTRLARNGKKILNWPTYKKSIYPHAGSMKELSEIEKKYSLNIPSITYAMFETALRAASERNLAEHQLHIGNLFERFSQIASKNRYSWIKENLTAEEIITPSPKNRNINHPYTKFMCSNPFVDQMGAVLLTTQEFAEELNIDPSKWVYLMGGGNMENIFNITQRPSFINSPAVKFASQLSLEQAGLTLDKINLFDFYSCFPSMVQIIRNALGLKEDDPRPLTITGGMPYFGGPWSNYSMHPIITAVDLIRKNSSLKIMQVANGGYNTHLSVGIYGNTPPQKSWNNEEFLKVQQEIYKEKLPKPVKVANGILTIEAYTILYKRDGTPDYGIVIGYLEKGVRALALLKEGKKTLGYLCQQELVGRKFEVFHNDETGFNYLKINE